MKELGAESPGHVLQGAGSQYNIYICLEQRKESPARFLAGPGWQLLEMQYKVPSSKGARVAQ